MDQACRIIKDGASAQGLRLIGDRMIGYRFVPRGDLAEVAEAMLVLVEQMAESTFSLPEWLEAHKDGEYSWKEWHGKEGGQS